MEVGETGRTVEVAGIWDETKEMLGESATTAGEREEEPAAEEEEEEAVDEKKTRCGEASDQW